MYLVHIMIRSLDQRPLIVVAVHSYLHFQSDH
jgi:hypothetical protein